MLVAESFGLFCHPGDAAVDVGANVGKTAFLISKLVGDHGSVFAIEPHPVTFMQLTSLISNLHLDNTKYILRAMSNREGFCDFYIGDNYKNPQASTIIEDLATKNRFEEKVLKMSIECERLDYFCERHSVSPKFVKIDVEGAEHLVFEGSYKLLTKSRPAFYFECGFTRIPPQHIYYLPNFDYTLFCADILYFEGKWISMEIDSLKKIVVPISDNLINILSNGCVMNIIACPNEILNDVAQKMTILTDEKFLEVIRIIHSNT